MTKEQASQYQTLFDEWMGAVEKIPLRQNKPGKEYHLDSNGGEIRALAKKYFTQLSAILAAAPDAPAEAEAHG